MSNSAEPADGSGGPRGATQASLSGLPGALRGYVRFVDRISDYVGVVAMSLVFLMIGVLLLDAITRNALDVPLHWCVEVAQFTLLAYFFLGGPMTLKDDDHVRMDLIYQTLSLRGKAIMDLLTSGCLLFYLVVMMIGSISSLRYAIATGERRFSMWNPSMIPIKALLVVCLALMLLQTVSMIFKHIGTIRGAQRT